MNLIYAGLPSFSELILIGSGLVLLFLIVAYVQIDKSDKETKNKIKIYFLLCLVAYVVLLFVNNS